MSNELKNRPSLPAGMKGIAVRAPWRALLCIALVACSAVGCALFGGRQKPLPKYSARTFFETVSVRGGGISADETRVLVTSDATGIFNVYSQPLDGSAPTQFTHSKTSSISGVSWFPADDRVIVSADQEGNELHHLYVRETDGTLLDLTPGENVKAQWAGWSGDDRYFWVLTNERDPRFFDLFRYAVATPKSTEYPRELIFRNDDGFSVGAISRNARWVALVKRRNNMDSDVYLWEAARPGSRPQHITPHEGNIAYGTATFTPDSKKLLLTSNEDSEWTRVWSYDLATGERKIAIEADWDVVGVGYSRSGRLKTVVTNEDASTVFRVEDVETGERIGMPTIASGEIVSAGVSRSGDWMALSVSSDTSPTDLYAWDRTKNSVRKLTDSLNPKIDESALVTSEVVRFKSFDGLEIPAILWKPKIAARGSRVPAVVWVHGGPGGQSRTGYNADIQYLTNHGYAVLAVNNRGSSGYGKTFFHADDRKHGDVDLKDCIYGRRYLQRQKWIDTWRIGIMGGSYGGYMVAAALTFQPNAFRVGIDIFGVTNWLRTLESIPPWWEAARESLYAEMGDPTTDRERLRAISPLFHADRIRRPLLVVQGANDPRVLKVESDEIVEAARKNGVPVEYLVFEDEGHGFRKRENRIRAAKTYRDFLDKYLTWSPPDGL